MKSILLIYPAKDDQNILENPAYMGWEWTRGLRENPPHRLTERLFRILQRLRKFEKNGIKHPRW